MMDYCGDLTLRAVHQQSPSKNDGGPKFEPVGITLNPVNHELQLGRESAPSTKKIYAAAFSRLGSWAMTLVIVWLI